METKPSDQPPSPEQRAQELRSLEPRVKRELRRHFLSERERIVADVLTENTLGLGLLHVRIPKLEVLSDLTGLERSHIHTALRSLHEMRIFTARIHEGITIAINTDSESWKVKPRIPRSTIQRGLDVIYAYNHTQPPPSATETPINFRDFDPAQFLLPGVTNSVTVPDFPELT